MLVCTGNSARSQIAEGLARHHGQGRVATLSAGTAPSRLNPYAARAMQENGIDISEQYSKAFDWDLAREMDVVVTVCSHANESCPVLPPEVKRLHWPLENPAAAKGSDARSWANSARSGTKSNPGSSSYFGPCPDESNRSLSPRCRLFPSTASFPVRHREIALKISVKIFGAKKLVDRMESKGHGLVEFPDGTVNDLFGHLLTQHGLTWVDFPLLEKWEENINIFILHNDDTLLKADYGRKRLADGDRLSFHIHTGYCWIEAMIAFSTGCASKSLRGGLPYGESDENGGQTTGCVREVHGSVSGGVPGLRRNGEGSACRRAARRQDS